MDALATKSNKKSKSFVYSGSLPAPSNKVGMIDYLILIKNGNNQVVQTQSYRIFVNVNSEYVQPSENTQPVNVYTELLQPPVELIGFSDNITFTAVNPQEKLGVTAGILITSSAGESTSNAIAGGTVLAESPGFSTTTNVLGSVGAAALVVGIVVGIVVGMSGGAGGDGDSGSAINSTTILGTWNLTEVYKDKSPSHSGTITFSAHGRYNTGNNLPGSWSIDGKYLTLIPDHSGVAWRATLSGNAQNLQLKVLPLRFIFLGNYLSNLIQWYGLWVWSIKG